MEATVGRAGDDHVLEFSFDTDRPPREVWAAITAPDRLATWLADGRIDLSPGGRVDLRFGNSGDVMAGVVTAVDDGELLEYTWTSRDAPDGRVRWRLSGGEAGGTRVSFSHLLPVADRLPRLAAGWQCHLEVLAGRLRGDRIEWSSARWSRLHQRYAEKWADPATTTAG